MSARILIAAVAVALLGAMVPPAASAAPAKTVVTTVTPFAGNGQLRVKLGYSSLDEIGGCDISPVATGKNVYQCGPSAVYLPACWPTPREGQIRVMVCLRKPGAKKAVTWSVFPDPSWSAVLPKVRPLADPLPWQVVLDNGSTCMVRLGGAWGIPPAGYDYSHGCTGSVDALLAPEHGAMLNTASAHYTVAGLAKSGAVRTFGVKKVVYAGAAPKAATVRATSGAACPARSALDKKISAKYPQLRAIGKVGCAGKWARVGITDGMSGGEALFKKVGGTWKLRDKNKLCGAKVGIPAAFAWVCYVG